MSIKTENDDAYSKQLIQDFLTDVCALEFDSDSGRWVSVEVLKDEIRDELFGAFPLVRSDVISGRNRDRYSLHSIAFP